MRRKTARSVQNPIARQSFLFVSGFFIDFHSNRNYRQFTLCDFTFTVSDYGLNRYPVSILGEKRRIDTQFYRMPRSGFVIIFQRNGLVFRRDFNNFGLRQAFQNKVPFKSRFLFKID